MELCVVHVGVVCDGCEEHPILGPRFVSLKKEDYDLCLNCYKFKNGNATDYQRIDVPLIPPAFQESILMESLAESGMQHDFNSDESTTSDPLWSLATNLRIRAEQAVAHSKYVEAIEQANCAIMLLNAYETSYPVEIACAHVVSAEAHKQLGNLREGRESILEALKFYDLIIDHVKKTPQATAAFCIGHNAAFAYQTAGSIYMAGHDDHKAKKFFAKAETLFEIPTSLAYCKSQSALLMNREGNYEGALSKLLECEKLCQQEFALGEDTQRVIATYSEICWTLGVTAMHMSHFQMAAEKFRLGAKLMATLHPHGLRDHRFATGLAMSLEHEGKHEEAVKCFQTAIDIHRRLDSKLDLARDLSNLGLLHLISQEVSRLPPAITALKECVAILAEIQEGLGPNATVERISLFEHHKRSYSYLQEAYGMLAIQKALAAGKEPEKEGEQLAVPVGGCCPRGESLCELCTAVLHSLICAERGRTRVLRYQLQETQLATEMTTFDSDDLVAMDVISRSCPSQSVIIEYAFGFQRLWIWILKESGQVYLSSIEFHTVVGPSDAATRTELDTTMLGRSMFVKMINETLEALTMPDDVPGLCALHKLHRHLIGPISDLLYKWIDDVPCDIVGTIIVVPDEDLFKVPFQALQPSEKDPFLIEECAIALEPSILVYKLCRQRAEQLLHCENVGDFLIVSDPKPLGTAKFLSILREAPGTKKGARWLTQKLNSTTTNCKPAPRVRTLIERNASKAQVLQHLQGAVWVQAFCHGLVNNEEDKMCPAGGIVLGTGASEGQRIKKGKEKLVEESGGTSSLSSLSLAERFSSEMGGELREAARQWKAAQGSYKGKEKLVEETRGTSKTASVSDSDEALLSKISDFFDEHSGGGYSAFHNMFSTQYAGFPMFTPPTSAEILSEMKLQEVDMSDQPQLMKYSHMIRKLQNSQPQQRPIISFQQRDVDQKEGILDGPKKLDSSKSVSDSASLILPDEIVHSLAFQAIQSIFSKLCAAYSSQKHKEQLINDPRFRMVGERELAGWASSEFEEHDRQGILPAEQIASLFGSKQESNLQARAVVLSACTTGRGTVTGEGLVGFARALILAGVPSVVLSGWEVDDAATFALMQCLYKNLLEKQLPLAHALREAMLTMLNWEYIEEELDDVDSLLGNSNRREIGTLPRKFRVWHWAAFHIVGDPETRFPYSSS